jgi:pimeloyl-ACP methyl ester carboxylesterase
MSDSGSERTLAVNGLRLACKLWGEPDALPTLALHGWLDNAASFDAVAPHLARVHLCALDLPGHGLSEHRAAHAGYHFIDYVPDVLGAADALGWDRFALVGHSMGGGIATLLAAAMPERVQRVVLIESLGPATNAASEAPAVLRRALADLLRAQRSSGVGYASFDEAVRARMAGIGKLSESAARTLCERGLERTANGFVWRADRRVRAGSRLRLTEEHALAFIREMKVPTLLIRAEAGYPYDEQQQAARIAAHPDLSIVCMAGSHHLHMEAGAAHVARLIDDFLLEGRVSSR